MAPTKLVERHVRGNPRGAGEGVQHHRERGAVGARPKRHGALSQGELRIAEQGGRICAGLHAQSFAGRAPTQGAVEREVVRRERLETPPATIAHKMLTVGLGGPLRLGHVVAGIDHAEHAAAQRQRVFHAAGDTRAGVGANRHAVDYHFDVVLAPSVDRRRLVDGVGLAVDADADVARRPRLFPQRFVAFAHADFQRGHHVQLRAGGMGHDLGDDLVGRLAADGHVARRTVRLAQPRHENPQIVVNLRDRAHGAPGRLAGMLLLDANGRREPLDVVDLRLLHLADELPGVGAQAFDVAALALGIDGVDGQRGLARPARPAADGELVAGDVDVDVLEIVLAGTADLDEAGELRRVRGTHRISLVRFTHPTAAREKRHGDQTSCGALGRCRKQSHDRWPRGLRACRRPRLARPLRPLPAPGR